MELTISIEKTHLVFLLAAVVVVMGFGLAVGYGTTNPSTFGHTPSEIDPGTFAGGGNYIFPATGDVQVGRNLEIGGNLTFDFCNSTDCGAQLVEVAGGMGWGSWQGLTLCPRGYYVCGLEQRVEPSQGGSGDDTAANDIRMFCCPF